MTAPAGRSGRLSRLRWRRARREAAARLAALAGDAAVALPCRARRTTARGWGEWATGLVHLPGPEGGEARFEVDDPSSVALVTRRGEAPVVLTPPMEVTVRDVRYRAEAFYGDDAEIVVATSPRRVVELAVPAGQAEPLARRLAALA